MAHVNFISFPSNSKLKVASIRSLRRMLNLGLKEAKEMIESLQLQTPTPINVELDLNDPLVDEAFKEYQKNGGVVKMDDEIINALHDLTCLAIDKRQYDKVSVLVAALEKLHNLR